MNISAIGSFKNIVKNGYTMPEAVLSVLPIVDAILLNDGGSEDATWEVMEHLQKMFPCTIGLYKHPWGGENCGAAFDDSLNKLMAATRKGSWIFEIQGDEIWNEKDIFAIKQIIETIDTQGYNSIRQRCQDVGWTHLGSYPSKNVRIARNISILRSCEWGDCFYIEGQKKVADGFTSHNVPPEFLASFVYYHLHRPFPLNHLSATEAMSFHNGAGDPPRTPLYERMKTYDFSQVRAPELSLVLPVLPALVKDLSQMLKYEVREELFNYEWLKETTKIDYKKWR